MSATLTTVLHEQVLVYLIPAPADQLQWVAQVAGALERAGLDEAAETFAELAQHCRTETELLDLINCTVTMI